MVKSVQVYHYDSFSIEANKGNPAGVVLDTENLTDWEMQEIASKLALMKLHFLLNLIRQTLEYVSSRQAMKWTFVVMQQLPRFML